MLGFPDEADMALMFGYVTPEDREKWDKQREQHLQAKAQQQQGRGKFTQHVAQPAVDFLQRDVSAAMTGARVEQSRSSSPKVQVTHTQGYNQDEWEMKQMMAEYERDQRFREQQRKIQEKVAREGVPFEF